MKFLIDDRGVYHLASNQGVSLCGKGTIRPATPEEMQKTTKNCSKCWQKVVEQADKEPLIVSLRTPSK